MPDKHSLILLKVITNEKLTNEESITLRKDFDLLLRKASENRVEYIFLKSLKKGFADLVAKDGIANEYEYGKAKSDLLHKTTSFFQKYLKGTEYAVIKTWYPFPAIVSDIDILFFEKKGYSNFVRRLSQAGFKYREDDELKGSLKKQGFMKCEPHNDISWHGMRFISKEFIRNNRTKIKVGGISITIPNQKAAFVISAAHILFDCQYLSLRDFIFLKGLVKDKAIVRACLDEAEKFGWKSGAQYFINIFSTKEEICFPFWIPIIRAYSLFKEKIIFDFKEKKENHLTTESIILPLIYYYWKKYRSKLSRRTYRNSWLY